MAAGKRYSAGAIFLQVVPVFANVQRAIEDEAKNIDRALGDSMERSGEKAGKRAGKAMAEGLVDEADKAGEKSAKKYAGHFETQVKSAIKSAQREIDSINGDAFTTMTEKARGSFEGIKKQLKDIKDIDFSVDFDAKAVTAKLAELRAEVTALTKGDHELNLHANLRQVEKDLAKVQALAEAVAKDRHEIRFGAKADLKQVEREIGSFEKKFQASIKGAMNSLGDSVHSKAAQVRAELNSLTDIEINIDMDASAAMADAAAAEAYLTMLLDDKTLTIDVRHDIDGAVKSLREFRQQFEEVQPEVVKAERAVGMFEKKLKDSSKKAAAALSGSLERKLNDIERDLLSMGDLRIGIDISAAAARTELAKITAALAEIDADDVDVDVSVATAAALAELRAFEKQLDAIDNRNVTPDVDVDTDGSIGRVGNDVKKSGRDAQDSANAFRSFNIVLLAAASIGPALIPVLAGIAGGLLAIGPAAAVAGFGLGAVLVGFSGLGGALQALGNQQDQAATTAQSSANRQRASAYAIRDAIEAVADARRNAARAAEDAAEAVADAQRAAARAAEDAAERVADARTEAADAIEDALERQKEAQEQYRDAVQEVKDAEEDLRAAREEARKDAESLAKRQRQNAVDERQAVLDLGEAQNQYNAVMADGSSTDTDKEQASVNLEQAQIALNDTRDEQVALADEAADYAKNGVDGSEKVKSAQEALTEALEAQKDAQDDLRESAEAADQARKDGAEAITEALEDQNEVLSDNARSVRQALEDQRESAADSARAIGDAQEALRRAREAATDDLAAIDAQAQAVNAAFDKLGPAGRKFALFLFSLREGFYAFRDDIQKVLLPSVQEAIEGFIGSRTAGIARKMMISLAAGFGEFVKALSQSFQGPAWTRFFEMMAESGPAIQKAYGTAFIKMMEGLADVLVTLAPYALDFARGLSRMMDGFAKWAASEEGADGLRSFMDYAKMVGPAVLDFFEGLFEALGNIAVALAPFGSIVLDAIDAFLELIAGMDPKVLGAILTALTVIVLASQVAYGVMTLSLSLGALFALTIGPWVFAIVGIMGALVILYKTNEDFRNFITDAWGEISTVLKSAWEDTIKPALDDFFRVIQRLWDEILEPFFAWLGPIIVWAAKKIIPLLAETFAEMVGQIGWIVEKILIPVLKAAAAIFLVVVKGIQWAWENILKPVWGAISAAVNFLWENVFKPIFGLIGDIVSTVFGAIVGAWTNILWPVIRTIGTTVIDLYRLYFKVAFVLIKAAFKLLGIGMKATWDVVLKPLFDLIGTGIGWVWSKSFKPVIGWIKTGWALMTAGLKVAWDEYGQPLFDFITDIALPALQIAFETVLGIIAGLWEGLKAAVGIPIKFVIEKVINEGIIGGFNHIADWVNVDGIDPVKTPEWMQNYATGGILPGYTPGRDPHVFHSASAGTLALSGGEAIMRPEWTRAMGPQYVDQMNSLAATGGVGAVKRAMGYATGGIVQAFAKGGVVFPVPGGYVNRSAYNLGHDGMDINHPYDATGKVPFFSATGGRVTTTGYSRGYGNAVFVSSPYGELVYGHGFDGTIQVSPGDTVAPGQWLANIGNTGNSDGAHLHFGFPGGTFGAAEALLSGALPATGKVGDGKPTRLIPGWLKDFVSHPLENFRSWVTDPIKNAAASITGSPMFGMIKEVPLALGKGVISKAMDIIPGWVKATVKGAKLPGAIAEVGTNLIGDAVGNVGGAIADGMGFAKGGILPYNGTMMYDNGGYLPPGMTTVMNLTGKPEPVFTDGQFDNLGIGGGEGFTYAPTFNKTDLTAADVVDDLDFHRRKVAREGRYGRNK